MIRLQRKLLDRADDSPEGRLAALKDKLQQAIELEHSTIPPYLYALYSIKNETNTEVGTIIRSVVLEEMLHMALACNVLNAIGGAPAIDKEGFIPTYPGHLPGSVQDSLIVGLAPLSKQLIHDVFMMIEEPEAGIDVDGYPINSAEIRDEEITIGVFYQHIIDELTALDKTGNIFTGKQERQLKTGFPRLQGKGVTDLDSAREAIRLIISQGEGSKTDPRSGDEFAHFYKYSEIYYGRGLISNPRGSTPPWTFEGRRIAFDAAGVQPVISNPKPNTYKSSRRLSDLNRTFNRGYSDLLRKLHLVFNGQPDYLGPALLGMQNLTEQARVMMSLEIVPGLTAGPTFQYIPA